MAAKDKFTVDQMIQALTASMGLVSVTAQKLKCNQQTVRNYIERYPAVKQAQLDARDEMIDLAEASLVRAVRKGEGWAVALMLKTLGKSRGYVEKQELDLSGELSLNLPQVFLPQPIQDDDSE